MVEPMVEATGVVLVIFGVTWRQERERQSTELA